MKTTIIMFILICFSLCSSAQNIELNGSSVSLPSGQEKITKDQAVQHTALKFKSNKVANDVIAMTRGDHLYKVGDILISFTSQKITDANQLSKTKAMSDHAFRSDPMYTSQLKHLNNNDILVVNYHIGDVGCYSIFANNAINTKRFSAMVQYAVADKSKADSIAQHIINHLKFKD